VVVGSDGRPDARLQRPDSDSDLRQVSFTLASGTGTNGHAPGHQDHDGHQLTAAEAELPWKRDDTQPGVPAWRSTNPDLDDDDDDDDESAEPPMSASSTGASSDSYHSRIRRDQVPNVKLDMNVTRY